MDIREQIVLLRDIDQAVAHGIPYSVSYIADTMEKLLAANDECCGMNPEGVADLEMRFEVLIKDYRTLHAALTKLSDTHANQTVHDALRGVNDCWISAAVQTKP